MISRWLVSLWLEGTLAQYPLLGTTLWAAHTFFTLQFQMRAFLPAADLAQLGRIGRIFADGYETLAAQAMDAGQLLFRIRPKYHLVLHIILSVTAEHPCFRRSGRNPHCNAAWLDEDFIGKIMRIMAKTHPRTVQVDALVRWLAGLPFLLGLTDA
jgi:hypothetical protein